MSDSDAIAVIGIACRLPGADDPATFWRNLCEGVDSVCDPPPGRLDSARWFSPDPRARNRTYCKRAGWLDPIDRFDAAYFRLSPREADMMAPMQRIFLEVAWAALEDAGHAGRRASRLVTGVFAGVVPVDSAEALIAAHDLDISPTAATGSAMSVVANRVSYLFDLGGPSLAVDTACSSALVATHLACQSLRAGECELAIVGGVNVGISPGRMVAFAKAGFFSPDGRCKPFDARGDGYVCGEGVAAVVLKPLRRARADGDPVYAVIRGTAVNQDGQTNGMTAPNARAQLKVLRAAYERAQVDPSSVGYVEAHGTGTALGDPIELRALAAMFAGQRRGGCGIGSVKGNVGHLEGAAGLASLIKVCLMLHHRTLVRSLHFERPNPHIDFVASPFFVVDRTRPWVTPNDTPRRAGVSSFGFGGTNAHAVLEEEPPQERVEAAAPSAQALVLSAHTPSALATLAGRVRALCVQPEPPPLASLCVSAATGRAERAHRLAAVASTHAELAAKLADPASLLHGEVDGRRRPRVAFLCAGQGSQQPRMAEALYRGEPHFRRALDRCAELLRPHLEVPLQELLYPPAGAERSLARTEFTQPAVFAVDWALAQMWIAWGVAPSVVIGHSLGEYVAACLAGVMTVEQALPLVAERARLMQALPAGGAMAAVMGEVDAVAELLRGREDVEVGAYNSPGSVVLAGDEAAVLAVCAELAARGLRTSRLPVSHAFHSRRVEPMLAAFRARVAAIQLRPPQLPLMSNLGGAPAGPEICEPDYWVRQIRAPVRFAAGIKRLVADGAHVLLEVGPGSTLTGLARECVRGLAEPPTLLASLGRGADDWTPVRTALARLWTLGAAIDWEAASDASARVWLPVTPLERERYGLLPMSAEVVAGAGEMSAGTGDGGVAGSDMSAGTGDGSMAGSDMSAGTGDGVGSGSSEMSAGTGDGVVAGAGEMSAGTGDGVGEGSSEMSAGAGDGVGAGASEMSAGTGEGARALLERYARARPALDRLAAAALAEILHACGLTGRSGSAAELTALAGVAPRHRRQFALLLRLAAMQGAVAETARGIEVPGERAAAGARWAELLAATLRELPEFRGEVGLLGACVAVYAEVLQGRRDVMSVLFPGGSLAEVEAVYRDAPLALRDTGLAARWLERRLQASAGAIEVLEIGAGTGGTTAGLAEVLRRAAGRVRYHFTDVTPAFLAHAEQRFGALGLRLARLDVERDPQAQGFAPGSFDVVVAAHVLHATRDLETTLRHVRGLLKPGGALLLIETTEPLLAWIHLIFGLTPGWWRFDGADGRVETPLRTVAAWREQLQRCGFSSAQVEGPGGPTSVLVAEADPRWVMSASAAVSARVAPGSGAAAMRMGDEAGSGAVSAYTVSEAGSGAGSAHAVGEPGLVRRVERALTAQLAATLRLPPRRIGSHTPFQELGLDSLLAQELAAGLAGWVGVEVPAGIVFQHTTTRALAEFLVANYAAELRARVDEGVIAQAAGSSGSVVASGAVVGSPGAVADARVAEASGAIAVVGVAVRLPGATSVDMLAERLASGEVMIGEAPPGRDELAGLRGRGVSTRGAFLAEVAGLDRALFGVSAREVAGMDPRQRIALELAHEALEHAGRGGPGRAGLRVGVYLGLSRELPTPAGADPLAARAESALGLSLAMAAARICHTFDLRGPSQTIDVHCAAGLVALHEACGALTAGECELALVGAVNVLADPAYLLALDGAGMLSRSGRCRPFASDGDGFVLGEGGVMLVVRPLAAAQAAGDPIHAVILGTAVGHFGRTLALGAPGPDGHAEIVRAAWRRAGVDAAMIDVIEAHGTGTRVGDAIEVLGLRTALAGAPPGCRLGSLKGQLGHTEVVAGLAGLVKVIGALRREAWPATVTGARLVPELDGGPLVLPTRTTPWLRGTRRRIAGVTAFGLAGTGAHAVIGEPPPAPSRSGAGRGAELLLLSAPSAAQLAGLAGELAAIAGSVDPGDLCFTLGAGRMRLPWRVAAVVRGAAELQARLSGWAAPRAGAGAVTVARTVIGFGPVAAGTRWLELAEVRGAALAALAAAEPRARAGAEAGLAGGPMTELAEFALLYGLGAALQRLLPGAEFAGRGVGAAVAAVLAGDTPLATAARGLERWSGRVHEEILLRAPEGPLLAVGAVDAGAVALDLMAGDPWEALLRGLAAVFVRGGEVDVERLYAGTGRRRVGLPGLRMAREGETDGRRAGRVGEGETVARASEGGLRGAALRRAVVGLLRSTVARELRVAAEQVEPQASLMALGLDSLTLERLVGTLGQWTGVALSPTLLFRLPTLADLAEHLAREHGPALAEALAASSRAGEGGSAAERADEGASASERRADDGARMVGASAAERRADEGASAAERRADGGGSASERRADDGARMVGGSAAERRADGGASAAERGGGPEGEAAIAIIGMACRLPGVDGVDALWELLRAGGDRVAEIPGDRWSVAGLPPACRWAALLAEPDRFDPEFFGISRREARGIDPQQRLVLNVAWEALERAGRAGGPRGRAIGVFVGTTTADFAEVLVRAGAEVGPHLVTGLNAAMLANRVSYTLDLRGPSVTINTACSSSLVAIHQACQSLRAGECELAIAGGVNLCLTPTGFAALNEARALSPTGRCRPFGADADGYVRGEGAAAVVLKRLDAALADGDPIAAIIRGSAVNQDGRTNGITAPNPSAQQAVIAAALRRARVDAESIGYVEAHGTGTRLGDPIEVEALDAAHARRSRCWIGSIKSNIGHLEAAAGVASLLKVVLALQHRALPPTLHVERQNPLCGLERRPFAPVLAYTPWASAGPRRAALSSFGFGGTNCHMIVEEAPARAPSRGFVGPLVLVLSAPSQPSLAALARRWAAALAVTNDAADLCFTAALGRARFAHRLAVTGVDAAGLARALLVAAAGTSGPGIHRGMVEDGAEDGQAEEADWAADPERVERAAAAFVAGEAVAWAAVFGPGRNRVVAPETPREELRIGWARARQDVVLRKAMLTGPLPVADHQVFGAPILPGAGFYEWMLAAGAELAGAPVRRLRAIVLQRPLPTPPGGVEVELRLRPAGNEGEPSIHLRPCAPENAPELAFASLSTAAIERPPAVDLLALALRCARAVDPALVYARAAACGLEYGPFFRTLAALRVGAGESLAELRAPDGAEGFLLHPGLVDGAVQAWAGAAFAERDDDAAVLPMYVEELRWHAPLPARVFCWARSHAAGVDPALLRADLVLLAPDGAVLVEFVGLCLRRVRRPEAAREVAGAVRGGGSGLAEAAGAVGVAAGAGFPEAWVRRVGWEEAPWTGPTRALPAGRWLALVDDEALAEALGARLAALGGVLVVASRGEGLRQVGAGRFVVDPREATALAELVVAAGPLAGVLHLGCTGAPERLPGGVAELEERLELGLFSLFALAQAVLKLGSGAELLVAVREPQAAPERAAMLGVVRVLAIEHPELRPRGLALTGSPAEAAEAIVAELCGGDAAITAWTGGQRATAALRPWSPGDAPARLPAGPGCIVVTGGAEGVGRAIAAMLARETGLPLVTVHRGPAEAHAQGLAALAAGGATVHHEQADVADEAALTAALAAARARFGAIRGVVHAAGVLQDRKLRTASRADLERVLRPKVVGTVLLDLLTRADRPALFVLCSSISALLGNVAQAAHGASNSFEDAYAGARTAALGLPTLAVNWGVWAETGVVQHPRYLEAMRARGITPMASAQASAALLAVLASDEDQVVIADIDVDRALAGWAGTPPARLCGPALAEALRRPLRAALGRLATAPEVFADFDRHAHRLAAAGLGPWIAGALGEGPLAPAELRARLGIAPGFVRQFAATLRILEVAGVVVTDPMGRLSPGQAAPGRAEALAAACASHPGAEPALTYLLECLGGYPEVLAGRREPLTVLFPGGQLARIAGVYASAPKFAEFHALLAETVEAAVARCGRPARVLEVGAGTGSATTFVLPKIAARCAEYVFTDVSPAFLRGAQQRVGGAACLRTAVFDVERPPEAQGLAPGSFDLVVAANVIHATSDIHRSLVHMRRLLAPGGHLVLLETTAAGAWGDLIFGLTGGWWAFTDLELRPEHCCMPAARWREAFAAAGFAATEAAPDGAKPTALAVLVAENATRGAAAVESVAVGRGGAAVESVAAAVERGAAAVERGAAAVEYGAAALESAAVGPARVVAGGPQGSAAPPEHRVRLVEGRIAARLAAVLERDVGRIGSHTPFLEFGLDSLMAVEVATGLGSELQLEVAPTLFFDHPTIAELARHLAGSTRAALGGEVGGAGLSDRLIAGAEGAGFADRSIAGVEGAGSADRLIAGVEGAGLADGLIAGAEGAGLSDRLIVGAEGAGLADRSRGGAVPVDRSLEGAIAVIGLACRVPGADSAEALWSLLAAGAEAVGPIPEDRWDLERFAGDGGISVGRGGFLREDVYAFDPLLFGISPAEAEVIDPQQRLFLMIAWAALEDAGLGGPALRGSEVGVFVGASAGHHAERFAGAAGLAADTDAGAVLGNVNAAIANRVSYVFGLQGPSLVVDTICSGSLVALHLAVQALRRGECEAAIVGGVHLHLSPSSMLAESRLGALAPDGRCKAFDAAADGFVTGEGAGAVVLKPLQRALADGVPIRAVIRGTAIGHDGRSSGLAAPSSSAQAGLLRRAYADAGVSPASVDYVEAHGTGTRLGDPIELEALRQVFAGAGARPGRCALGSLKTNLGHLEAAAGIAGLIKVIVMLERAMLPASLHMQRPNPLLQLVGSPFFVVDRLRPWAAPVGRARRAAISSFGMSGANAHAIVEAFVDGRQVEGPLHGRGSVEGVVDGRQVEGHLHGRGIVEGVADGRQVEGPWHGRGSVEGVVDGRQVVAGVAGVVGARAMLSASVRRGDHGDGGVSGPQLIPLSARTEEALVAVRQRLAAWLAGREGEDLAALAWTLQAGRAHLARRCALVVEDVAALQAGLVAPPWIGVAPARRPALALWIGGPIELGELAVGGAQAAVSVLRSVGVVADMIVVAGPYREGLVALARAEEVPMVERAPAGALLLALGGAGSLAPPGDGAVVPVFAGGSARRGLLAALAALYVAGWEPRWAALHAGRPRRVALPGYPFARELCRVPGPTDARADAGGERGAEAVAGCGWRLEWRPAPVTGEAIVPVAAGRVFLLVLDGLGVAAQLAGELRRRGARVVELSGGRRFRRLTPERLVADLRRGEDLAAVREALVGAGAREVVVVHAASLRLAEAAERLDELRGVVEEELLGLAGLLRVVVSGPGLGLAGLCALTAYADAVASESVAPERALVSALVRVAARELPGAPVVLCDLDVEAASVASCAEQALVELAAGLGAREGAGTRHVAYRGGRRFTPELRPRALPAGRAPLARGVAVVITGGTRGLGLVVARHLARSRGARLLLLSRSARADEAALTGELRALGAAAVIVRDCDVGDGAAVEAALAAGRAAFGAIDLVVHAAGALRDAPLVALRDEDWAQVLRAKVFGTWHLLQAVAEQPGTRVLLFASLAALLAGPGQAAHAAACAYQLACATAAAQRGRAVQAIAWGLWSESGVARGLSAALGRRGIGGLTNAEGLEGLERALALGAANVTIARLDLASLDLGVAGAGPQDAGSSPGGAERGARGVVAGAGAERGERAVVAGAGEDPSFAALVAAASERYAAGYGARGLAGSRGVVEALNAAALVAAHAEGVTPPSSPRFRRLWAAIEAARRQPRPEGSLAQRIAAGRARFPAHAHEFTLIERCAAGLPAVLAGTRAASDVLFPGGSTELMAQIYAESPAPTLCADALAAVLGRALAGRGGAVLEVGAGLGGTTRLLLPRLVGLASEYVFTDVVDAFVAGAEQLRSPVPVRALRFDIDAPPAAQGLAPGSFAAVLATNAVHAARDLPAALEHLRSLLRPGGLLLLVECTRPLLYLDLTMGLLDGWWRFADGLRETSPLLGPAQWRAALSEGFAEVALVPEETCAAQLHTGVTLIVARTRETRETRPSGSARDVAVVRRDAVVSRGRDVEVAVTGALTAALRIDRAAIDLDMPLFDLGLDSLRGVEVCRALSRELGVAVAPELLFRYPTARALALALAEQAPAVTGEAAAEGGELEGEARGGSAEGGELEGEARGGVEGRGELEGGEAAREGIAVVGLACRLPGIESPAELWQALLAGRSTVTRATRWSGPEVHHGSFFADLAGFDPLGFQIGPREAAQIDPQQRLALEVALAALEDAALAGPGLAGSRTGVFVGAAPGEYGARIAAGEVEATTGAGLALAIVANRVSYCFDLRGPSLVIDTACSSSLVALHAACAALRAGECERAIVLGVNTMLTPDRHALLAAARVLAPDGRNKAFAEGADGYARGEGAVALVLRRLGPALAEGDTIRALVTATAVGQDGRTNGISAPNPEAQTTVILDAWARARIDPEQIGLWEAHGTGTALGDPIEVAAASAAFRRFTRRAGFVALGSVKSNFGHLEPAAGLLGVLKAILSLEAGVAPPTLHVATASRAIDFVGSPFFLCDRPTPWSGRRLAAISAFGFGGTNAHAVLAAAPVVAPRGVAARRQVLALSARTDTSLRALAGSLLALLRGPTPPPLADLCFSMNTGRRAWPRRVAAIGSSPEALARSLEAGLAGAAIVGSGSEEALARRWLAGEAIDWAALGPGRRIPLPTYPHERRRCWIEARERAPGSEGVGDTAILRATEPARGSEDFGDTAILRVAWVPAPVSGAAVGLPDEVVVVGAGEVAEAVVGALAAAGVRIRRAAPGEVEGTATDVVVVDEPGPEGASGAEAIAEAAGRRLEAARGLAQRLATAGRGRARRLWFVGPDPRGAPAAAAVQALARVAGRELASTTVRIVAADHGLAAALLAEMRDPAAPSEVVHRDGQRWMRTLVPAPVPAAAMPAPEGPVLITGGLGGLGQRLARMLARAGARRIATLGRNVAHAESLRGELAGLGAELLALQADVADRTSLSAALATLRARWGAPVWLVHGAGVVDTAAFSLAGKQAGAFAAVLAPKLRGTLLLRELLAATPPRRVLLHASLAGVSGAAGAGLADYAAANAFLDGLAELYADAGWLALDWGLWDGVGLGAATRQADQGRLGLRPLAPAQAEAALAGLLAAEVGGARVVVAPADRAFTPQRLLAGPGETVGSRGAGQVGIATSVGPRATRGAEEIATRASERATERGAVEGSTLAFLIELVEQRLGVPAHEIDPRASLADYGVDSLALADMLVRLERRLGFALSPTDLLTQPTLAGLAALLDELQADAGTPTADEVTRAMPEEPRDAAADARTSWDEPRAADARTSGDEPPELAVLVALASGEIDEETALARLSALAGGTQ